MFFNWVNGGAGLCAGKITNPRNLHPVIGIEMPEQEVIDADFRIQIGSIYSPKIRHRQAIAKNQDKNELIRLIAGINIYLDNLI